MLTTAPARPGPGSGAPLLRLDGFEGPLDLLLELARAQKVDLARISILQLVEQYLAIVEQERQVRLELAADWLVMAAWLTWLKSRLLLPRDEAPEDSAEPAGELLAMRLAELARIERAAGWLDTRDRLGHEVFARGAPEDLTVVDRSGLKLEMGQLLSGYLAARRRTARRRVYRPKPVSLWTPQEAMSRVRLLLGEFGPGWSTLDAFLPEWLGVARPDPGERALRGAIAACLLAGLELARDGGIELRQSAPFGAIALRVGGAEALYRAAE